MAKSKTGSERVSPQPPAVDYKIGNGGIRDLFRYIFGGQEARDSMKIVRKFRGKETIIKDIVQKQIIGDSIGETINQSNVTSRMAGERASAIQQDMRRAIDEQYRGSRRDVTGDLREAATYPPGYRESLVDRQIPTIGRREGPTRMRPMRGYSPLGMAGETNIVDRSRFRRGAPETYARGDPSAITESEPPIRLVDDEPPIRVEDDPYVGDPEVGFGRTRDWTDYSQGKDTIGYRYGGAVPPKRKKRKKRLYKGGKVNSYNY